MQKKYVMTIDLFVSCIVDQFYPLTAMNVLKLLHAADVTVEYNHEQTCCGKIAYHSGNLEDAKELGKKFLKDFPNNRLVVGIDASCVGFIKSHYKDLFHNTASHLEYKRLVSNIYEFTDFLVNKLKFTDFNASFPHRVVYHDSCSSLRELNLKDEGRILLSHVKGIQIVDLRYPEICCGLGRGMFSIKHHAISAAMTGHKLEDAVNSGAEYFVTNDMACLMNLDCYARKQNIDIKVVHIADVLASGW